jgi:phosphoglycerate dehydrogenase-like enzyme
MFPELVASGVRVTSSAEIHGRVVAEHAVTLVLALAKGLPLTARYQVQHKWGQNDLWRGPMRPREFSGATLGIIGLGAIGKHCVPLAKGLGMRVLAIREHPERGSEGADEVLGTDRVTEMLARAEYVLLAAPLTSKTKTLFNDATFAAMRPDACFINLSRGELVDESALHRTLSEKKIRAAALDVFETEPLPASSPLWDLENLLITPHTAAITEKLWERHYARITDNLRRYLAGEPLLGEVNKQKGY